MHFVNLLKMSLAKKKDLVILCGGIGSRLGKITKKTPKPLIEINKRPFIEYLLKKFQKYNFDNIYLLAGYKGHEFKRRYHKKFYNLTECKVIVEKTRKGTGGSLFELKDKIKNNFLLINADSFLDIDLSNFFRLKNKKICKMILIKNNNYKQNNKLSTLNLDKKKNIQISLSKKKNYMNSGIYFMSKDIFSYVENKNLSLEIDILPKLIQKKFVEGVLEKSFFIDIGTLSNLKYSKQNYKKFIKSKAIIFDRDGVINIDTGYLNKTKDLIWNKKILNILKKIDETNKYKFIVTNQSGIGRGYYSKKSFKIFQKKYYSLLEKDQIFFDDIKYCPHHPVKGRKLFRIKCNCRKPKNGMIETLLKEWQLNRKNVGMIGDSKTDYLASMKSKIKFIYSHKSEKEILKFIKKI